VLFLHWLGQINSDRDEFLAEAITLAHRGVVAVLPQGTFPYTVDPAGTSADVAAVQHQLDAYRAALRTLFDRQDVDAARVALVGHDYGAMYGSLLVDRDHRIRTAVLATPDATWGNWFITYWHPELPPATPTSSPRSTRSGTSPCSAHTYYSSSPARTSTSTPPPVAG